MAQSTSVPPEVFESVRGVLAQLDAEMQRVAEEDGAPNIRGHLELLNNNLRRNPELVHLLSEEDIAPYYKAVVAQAELVFAPVKKAKAAKSEAVQKKAEVAASIDNLFGI